MVMESLSIEVGYRRRERSAYHGIDRCDNCGQPLEKRQSLCGLCKACEAAAKAPKGRPLETLKPRKGLVS